MTKHSLYIKGLSQIVMSGPHNKNITCKIWISSDNTECWVDSPVVQIFKHALKPCVSCFRLTRDPDDIPNRKSSLSVQICRNGLAHVHIPLLLRKQWGIFNMLPAPLTVIPLYFPLFHTHGMLYPYSLSDGGGWSKMNVSFSESSQSILKRFSWNFVNPIL